VKAVSSLIVSVTLIIAMLNNIFIYCDLIYSQIH
jgi:hypothetical protein